MWDRLSRISPGIARAWFFDASPGGVRERRGQDQETSKNGEKASHQKAYVRQGIHVPGTANGVGYQRGRKNDGRCHDDKPATNFTHALSFLPDGPGE
jgi:hypothetical protein